MLVLLLRQPQRFHTTAQNHESNNYTEALDVFVALTGPMRVKIVRRLKPSEFEPFDVSHFEVGRIYNVGPKLGALLVVAGYAEPEMRAVDRADDPGHTPDRTR